MEVRDKLYIGGAWVSSTGTGTIDVVNSATEEVMGPSPKAPPRTSTAPRGPRRRRLPRRGRTTSRDERAKTLARVQEALSARTEEIATLISKEVGMPFTLSNLIQVGLPVMSFAAAAAARHRVPLRGADGQLPHRARARRRRRVPSRRGTTRCTRSPPRWPRPSPRAAPWC